jgi:hypothetical protein
VDLKVGFSVSISESNSSSRTQLESALDSRLTASHAKDSHPTRIPLRVFCRRTSVSLWRGRWPLVIEPNIVWNNVLVAGDAILQWGADSDLHPAIAASSSLISRPTAIELPTSEVRKGSSRSSARKLVS